MLNINWLLRSKLGRAALLLLIADRTGFLPVDAAAAKLAFAAPSQMMVERTVDGDSFLQDMSDAANALKAYSFNYETIVNKGSKTIDQKGVFYFKQPRLLRVEMTGDYKRGAVAVMGPDGKIKGHLGGALSMFSMTLSPTSDLLVGANGYPMVDSDFAGMSQVVAKFIQQGSKAKVTEHPVAVEGLGKKVYVLELYNGPQLFKRAYIDPKTLLPLQWFDYQDGRLFATTTWQNVKLEPDMKDSLFQL